MPVHYDDEENVGYRDDDAAPPAVRVTEGDLVQSILSTQDEARREATVPEPTGSAIAADWFIQRLAEYMVGGDIDPRAIMHDREFMEELSRRNPREILAYAERYGYGGNLSEDQIRYLQSAWKDAQQEINPDGPQAGIRRRTAGTRVAGAAPTVSEFDALVENPAALAAERMAVHDFIAAREGASPLTSSQAEILRRETSNQQRAAAGVAGLQSRAREYIERTEGITRTPSNLDLEGQRRRDLMEMEVREIAVPWDRKPETFDPVGRLSAEEGGMGEAADAYRARSGMPAMSVPAGGWPTPPSEEDYAARRRELIRLSTEVRREDDRRGLTQNRIIQPSDLQGIRAIQAERDIEGEINRAVRNLGEEHPYTVHLKQEKVRGDYSEGRLAPGGVTPAGLTGDARTQMMLNSMSEPELASHFQNLLRGDHQWTGPELDAYNKWNKDLQEKAQLVAAIEAAENEDTEVLEDLREKYRDKEIAALEQAREEIRGMTIGQGDFMPSSGRQDDIELDPEFSELARRVAQQDERRVMRSREMRRLGIRIDRLRREDDPEFEGSQVEVKVDDRADLVDPVIPKLEARDVRKLEELAGVMQGRATELREDLRREGALPMSEEESIRWISEQGPKELERFKRQGIKSALSRRTEKRFHDLYSDLAASAATGFDDRAPATVRWKRKWKKQVPAMQADLRAIELIHDNPGMTERAARNQFRRDDMEAQKQYRFAEDRAEGILSGIRAYRENLEQARNFRTAAADLSLSPRERRRYAQRARSAELSAAPGILDKKRGTIRVGDIFPDAKRALAVIDPDSKGVNKELRDFLPVLQAERLTQRYAPLVRGPVELDRFGAVVLPTRPGEGLLESYPHRQAGLEIAGRVDAGQLSEEARQAFSEMTPQDAAQMMRTPFEDKPIRRHTVRDQRIRMRT